MTVQANLEREINAVPLLVYYDIFKNYYANKQEDNAFVISPNLVNMSASINKITYQNTAYQDGDTIQVSPLTPISVEGTNLVVNGELQIKILDEITAKEYTNVKFFKQTPTEVVFATYTNVGIAVTTTNTNWTTDGINLTSFPLENIDLMRETLLKECEIGQTYFVNDFKNGSLMQQPYAAACEFNTQYRIGAQSQPMCGLVVKTYQSDLFNNWIKTETIDGANGIKDVTRVDTTNGLELDALNLAQKVYNMLNRIAVSGGTYEDWQEAVYTQSNIRKAETPMYVGGMSSEIMFEEVIATTEAGEDQAIGSLGGRGKQIGQKGGRIEFTIEEPSIIMAIVSLTPRICYSQGNKWFLTDFDSIDDVHKPALDGIGYQDLLVERMAWWDTRVENKIINGVVQTAITRNSAGKVPAWIEYMTDVDECYGDFALDAATSFMVLNRDYEKDENDQVTDITTYIDPEKYNYAFAVNDLLAQNFWAEIQFGVTARRLMSAKQIPNL